MVPKDCDLTAVWSDSGVRVILRNDFAKMVFQASDPDWEIVRLRFVCPIRRELRGVVHGTRYERHAA